MGLLHRLIRSTSSAAVLVALAGLAACGERTPSGTEDETGTGRPTTPTTPTGTGSEPAPATPRTDPAPPTGTPAAPSAANPAAPAVSELELAAAAASANQFAFDLFRRAAPAGENAVISPLNVRHALALAWAGAAGQTRDAMTAAMHLSADPGAEDQQHAALAALVAHALTPIGEQPAPEAGEPDTRPQVSYASRVWVQDGYALADGYQPRIQGAYGSAFQPIDFRAGPDAARSSINEWVGQQTRDRIPEVLPQGSITADTRLVLSAAVYLKAAWAGPFEKESTWDGPFTLAGGQSIETAMMHQTTRRAHAVTDAYTAVELPYIGTPLAMVLVMPGDDLAAFEADLDAPAWEAIVESLSDGEVRLTMPKFEFDAAADLAGPLKAMGMQVAFTDNADFSRMVSHESLMIGGVYHGAFLRVDEAGTEAAAATAVTMNVTSAPMEQPEPVEITLDRPFLLAIRDRESGAILFLGRVVDPR